MNTTYFLIDTSFDCNGMKSSQPRFTHKVCAVSLLEYAIRLGKAAGEACPIILRDESQAGVLETLLSDREIPSVCVSDTEQWNRIFTEEGYTVIVPDNLPLLTASTLQAFLRQVHTDFASLGKGTGVVCLRTEKLKQLLNRQTSMSEIVKLCEKESVIQVEQEETLAVKNRVDLAKAEKEKRRLINEQHMLNGVTMIDPEHVYIGADVQIGRDCTIYPGNVIEGNTVIGANTILYPNNHLLNCSIGDGCSLRGVVADSATVEDGVRLGPYVHLRPASVLRKGSFAGAFVEMKNADFGAGSKCAHLAYVGDADVGERCNIGCGVVFVNYDGKHKHRTTVGNHAFIGSNSNLVAPVTVGDEAFVAAGSTVTENVPGDALCIARSRQTVKPEWVSKKGQW